MAREQRLRPVEDKDKKKITREGLQKALVIFRFIWPYKVYFIIGLIFLGFSSLTVLVFPYITGQLVDVATSNTATTDRNTLALAMIGILVFQALFSFMRVFLFALVTENAMRDIRLSVFGKLIGLPLPYFEKHRVGELVSRLTSDVSQLQDILAFTLAEFFRQIITLLVGVGIIFFTSTKLTLVMLSSFPLLVVGAMLFGRFIRKLSKKSQDELAQANVVAEETLQAVQVVKAFTNEFLEVARFGKALNKVKENALKTATYRGAFISFVIFAIFGGIVLVLWYGLGLVASGEITIGSLVSFIIYTTFIGGAVGGIGDLYGQLQKTIGASERLAEILQEGAEIDTQQNPADNYYRLKGEISFENLAFAYPSRADTDILKGLNMRVPEGAKVALVGHSGAGKTTILQLLLRYYNVERGQIVIDGQAISRMPLNLLRGNIAVVPQEVMLFGGTIRENIAYGKPSATDEEILAAAKQANAYEFISRFPEGLDTIVGERGLKLSGGQRQRIAIARAVLKDPAILLLDEATSSLDAESELLVQEALEELMKGRTTIIIAHRLSTIRKVDTIFVIQDGRVAEAGNHEELSQLEGGLYANLLKLQFQEA